MGLNAAVVEGAPRLRAPRVPDVPVPDAPRSERSLVPGTDRPRREDARRERATRSRREEKDAEGAARGAVASDTDDIGTGASVRRGTAARGVSACAKTRRARASVRGVPATRSSLDERDSSDASGRTRVGASRMTHATFAGRRSMSRDG